MKAVEVCRLSMSQIQKVFAVMDASYINRKKRTDIASVKDKDLCLFYSSLIRQTNQASLVDPSLWSAKQMFQDIRFFLFLFSFL